MARRQLGTAPSNAADTATKGYVDTAVTNLPASATPDAARLVMETSNGGNSASDGANTWAKLVTIQITDAFTNQNLTLLVGNRSATTADSAIVTLNAFNNNYNVAPSIDLKILGLSGTMISAFKLTAAGATNASGQTTTYELWVKKAANFGTLVVYELTRPRYSGMPSTVTYNASAAWQSAEPSGAVANVTATEVTAANVPVVTTTGTQSLSNKTISGANNTITNLPASATPDAARLVCKTSNGGTTTENGANTWAKIATISTGTQQSTDVNVILAFTNSFTSGHDSAIISIKFRSGTTGANPTSGIDMVAKSGQGISLASDSFKLINGGWGTDAELWIKKTSTYCAFSVYELSRSVSSAGNASITYNNNATWQSAEPVGATRNISTAGVTATGVPVVTESGQQTLTNKTLSADAQVFTDSGGAKTLEVRRGTASDVNFLRVYSAASGSTPSIDANGSSSTNVGIGLSPKGSGPIQIYCTAGNTPRIAAIGADTNVNLNLTTQGTGVIQANGNPVGVKVAVPSTATSTGVEGQWAADSSYIYVCTATNTWRRAALSTW